MMLGKIKHYVLEMWSLRWLWNTELDRSKWQRKEELALGLEHLFLPSDISALGSRAFRRGLFLHPQLSWASSWQTADSGTSGPP